MDTLTFAPTPSSADPSQKKANSRRATQACLKCRRRKVRCDVTRTGGPCTNCRLDDAPCEVASRAPRKFEHDLIPSQSNTTPAPTNNLLNDSDTSMTIDGPSSTQRDDQSALRQQDSPSNHSYENFVGEPVAMIVETLMEEANYASSSSSGSHGFQMLDLIDDMESQPPVTISIADPGWTNLAPICNGGMVEDRVFLDFQGCFMIPTRPVLDEFLYQYFSHIHPLLPMIGRESGLGSLLQRQDSMAHSGSRPCGLISGFLLQSMLFAASPYVSDDTIKALGYPSLSAARQSFYERAKLLYDYDTELDNVTIAQSALLLTYWCPNPSSTSKQHANYTWLRIAIEHARAAGADKASQNIDPRNKDERKTKEHTRMSNVLRRLWWCCITRDRIMALCIRKSIRITNENFAFQSCAPLSSEDLAADIGASRVHGYAARQAMASIFILLTELWAAMTDVCCLVYAANEYGKLDTGGSPEERLSRHRLAKSRLNEWSQKAGERLGHVISTAEAEDLLGADSSRHIILQANLLRIYYHAAVVALSNYELQLAISASKDRPNTTVPARDLCSSSIAIASSLQRLLDLQIANWFPRSVLGCIALPFALHIMSVTHYGSLNREYPRFSKALKASESRLRTLMDAVKECHARYEGAEWISEITLAALPGLESQAAESGATTGGTRVFEDPGTPTASNEEAVMYLTDLITQSPFVYIRLSMTLDLGQRLDRMPQVSDFPPHLQQKLFPGRDPSNNSTLEDLSTTAASRPSTPDTSLAREQLLRRWVEVDRSLFYLHELGMIP